MVSIAFEKQNGIYYMFQHFGPCQTAFFVDMTDQNDRHAQSLGHLKQRCCTFPHLGNAAG